MSAGPFVVEDLRTENRFADAELLLEHRVVSGLSTTIHAGGRACGVLSAHTGNRRAFTEDEVLFLQEVAEVLGAAIERHRAERDKESLLGERTAWAAAAASTEYRTVLTTAARFTVPAIADWRFVDVVEETEGTVNRFTIAYSQPEVLARARGRSASLSRRDSSGVSGFRPLEDQPRTLEALAYRLAAPAGYDAPQPVALAGEFLERLDQLLAVQDEDHLVLFGEFLDGLAARFFGAHGFGEQSLALGRLGPEPAPANVGLGLEGGVPPAPVLYVLFDPVQYSLYGGPTLLAHRDPPLSVCPNSTQLYPYFAPRARTLSRRRLALAPDHEHGPVGVAYHRIGDAARRSGRRPHRRKGRKRGVS